MTRYGMLVRADLCVGCKVCVTACKDEFEGNDFKPYSAAQPQTLVTYAPSFYPSPSASLKVSVDSGQEWISVSNQVNGTYPNVNSKYLPLPCVQCDNPPCLTAAQGGAVYVRPDKIVIIDPAKSASQQQIVASCPYNKVSWNAGQSIPQKCTFCAHLIDQGKNPKCVDSCPVSALVFGDLDDPNSDVSKAISAFNAKPIRPELGTSPKVYVTGL